MKAQAMSADIRQTQRKPAQSSKSQNMPQRVAR